MHWNDATFRGGARPRLAALVMAMGLAAGTARAPILACGPAFPNWVLVDADQSAAAAPVAWFDVELERMHLMPTNRRARPSRDYAADTLEKELADLRLALAKEGFPPDDLEGVIDRHRRERAKIEPFSSSPDATPQDKSPGNADGYRLRPDPKTSPRLGVDLPRITPGLPGEFADYWEGSVAWHRGDLPAARRAWQKLLERPAAERHFKSTWAAFMLGRSWEEEKPGRAIAYFNQVRDLADHGWSDSLGLSVASLGWEARLHWRGGRYAEATDLYLEQAAAGDPTAANSLRFVAAHALDGGSRILEIMARHPNAQRVVTAYVIAGGYARAAIDIDGIIKEQTLNLWEAAARRVSGLPGPNPGSHAFKQPVLLWLEAVEKAGVRDVDSAEQLALASYQSGEFETARRWLARAQSTALARWLKAKLHLREGQTDQAAALLASLCREFPAADPATNPPTANTLFARLYVSAGDFEQVPAPQQARAELGLHQLARRQFVEALDALLHSAPTYWMDAAYVAERVLTLDELTTYVDRHWPPPEPTADRFSVTAEQEQAALNEAQRATWNFSTDQNIRYLLARRLVRQKEFARARRYMPEPWLALFDRLVSAHEQALDTKRPGTERAQRLFEAARLTRRYGLELLGTEVGPDWRIHDGNFTQGVDAEERAAQKDLSELGPSDLELERARQHETDPERRWYYRHVAASLALRAARILCENPPPDLTPAQRAERLMESARFTIRHRISFIPHPSPVIPEKQYGTPEALWTGGYTAAALAWEAAQLLPNNSDQTARVLCEGGTWIKYLNPKAADVLYKALVRRCRKTALGAEADRLRWFPPLDKASGTADDEPE